MPSGVDRSMMALALTCISCFLALNRDDPLGGDASLINAQCNDPLGGDASLINRRFDFGFSLNHRVSSL